MCIPSDSSDENSQFHSSLTQVRIKYYIYNISQYKIRSFKFDTWDII